jgi:hypothetical protein
MINALYTFVWLYFFNLLASLSRGGARVHERLGGLLSGSLGVTGWVGRLVALVLTLIGGDLLILAYGSRFLGVHPTLAVLA